MNKKIKISVIVLATVLVAVLAGGFTYYKYLNYKIDEGLKGNQVEAVNPTHKDVPQTERHQENILVIGSDSRYDNNGEGSSSNNEGQRSDTMILLSLSKDRKAITGVSIPRDLMVENPEKCKIWNPRTEKTTEEDYTFPNPMQINSAFNIGGPSCAIKQIEHLSNLKINRYIQIDFNGFRNVIDALGGIDITVCRPMIDTNIGPIFKDAGTHHVNGQKALDFARARHVTGDTGSDLSRIHRQQYVIKQIIEQKVSSSLIFDVSKTNKLIDTFIENTKTDNVNGDFLVSLVQDVRTLGLNNINFHSLPTTEYATDPNRLSMITDQSQWLFGKMDKGEAVSKSDLENWNKKSTSAKSINPSPTSAAPAYTEKPTPKVEYKNPEKCGW